MMSRKFSQPCCRASLLLLAAILFCPMMGPRKATGQEQSVNPGINKSFEDPNVGDFVERFEKEGREVYDKRDEVIRRCGVEPGAAVADIGAGTGLYTRLLAAKAGKQGRVYAVDIAEKFVNHVVKTSREAGLKNVVGVVCQSDSVALPASSVDIVFICDTYHHFEYPQSTMQSIAKALRPDGIVCLIDFERIEGVSSEWILGHVRAGKEVVRREIEDSGFEFVEELEIFEQNYFLKFRKK